MIIMSIFLILSVVLVVITAIYLNYKKKNASNLKEITMQQENNTKITNKKSKKQLADILNIKIANDIISLGNNRYSSIVRLGNIDYNMLSDSEQDSIEGILIQTALAVDYPVQFFSTTEYIDTTNVIELIKKNKHYNRNIREYQKYLIEYLQNLMETKSISIIKNYAVISYDGLYEKAKEELARKTTLFKSSLLRARITCEVLEENELYNLIYRELNKNSNLNINNLKKGEKKLYVDKKEKGKNKRSKHI